MDGRFIHVCNEGKKPPFVMAFQPVVDTADNWRIYAYEALVRGPNGEAASAVLDAVPRNEALAFDAACRKKALTTAQSLGLRAKLSLNVMPEAVGSYRYGLHATVHAAREMGFAASRLIFEVTEHAPIANLGKLTRWSAAARNRGIAVALDDFGTGHANLAALLQLQPRIVKLGMTLVRGIDTDRPRQALMRGISLACESFGSLVVAEGVETEQEYRTLHALGIRLMQGYFIARPEVAALPEISSRRGIAVRNSHERQGHERVSYV